MKINSIIFQDIITIILLVLTIVMLLFSIKLYGVTIPKVLTISLMFGILMYSILNTCYKLEDVFCKGYYISSEEQGIYKVTIVKYTAFIKYYIEISNLSYKECKDIIEADYQKISEEHLRLFGKPMKPLANLVFKQE